MINNIIEWMNANPVIKQSLIIIGVLLLSFISYFITKKIILKGIIDRTIIQKLERDAGKRRQMH